jgi:hypothetical protein
MNAILGILSLSLILAAPSRAGEQGVDSPWAVYRVEMDMAERIQRQVLDHVLGPGQSAVFVTLEVEFSSQEESSSRDGMGLVEKLKGVEVSTGDNTSDNLLNGLGFSNSESTATAAGGRHSAPGRSQASQSQRASQTKSARESKLAVQRVAKRLAVRVLYDPKLAGAQVDAARESLKAVLEPQSKEADIKFIAAAFWK